MSFSDGARSFGRRSAPVRSGGDPATLNDPLPRQKLEALKERWQEVADLIDVSAEEINENEFFAQVDGLLIPGLSIVRNMVIDADDFQDLFDQGADMAIRFRDMMLDAKDGRLDGPDIDNPRDVTYGDAQIFYRQMQRIAEYWRGLVQLSSAMSITGSAAELFDRLSAEFLALIRDLVKALDNLIDKVNKWSIGLVVGGVLGAGALFYFGNKMTTARGNQAIRGLKAWKGR